MPTSGTIVHTFQHPWLVVSFANWQKYPTPQRPDLVSVDIIDKYVDDETGKLHIKRLFIIRSLGYPKWLEKILGQNSAFFVEDTVVDIEKSELVMKNRNISFSNILKLNETCRYTPSEANPETHTFFQQTAEVTAHTPGLSGFVEKFCASKFQSNAHKGQNVMEEAIVRARREYASLVNTVDSFIEGQKVVAIEMIQNQKRVATQFASDVEEFTNRTVKEVEEVTKKTIKEVEEVTQKTMKEVEAVTQKTIREVESVAQKLDFDISRKEKGSISVSLSYSTELETPVSLSSNFSDPKLVDAPFSFASFSARSFFPEFRHRTVFEKWCIWRGFNPAVFGGIDL